MANNEACRGIGWRHSGSIVGGDVYEKGGEDTCQPPQPHLEAIMAKLGRCFDAADEAAKRAGALADRAVGAPQGVPNHACSGAPTQCGGEVGAIYEMIDGLSLRIHDAIDEISRLERL